MPAAAPKASLLNQDTLAQIARAIKLQRKTMGVSAVNAAQAAGISRVTLHRIESNPSAVTFGAVLNVLDAVGLLLHTSPKQAVKAISLLQTDLPAQGAGWIPIEVRLSQYPALKQLAWHIHGTDVLTPQQAWEIYTRNTRHIELLTVPTHEQHLMDALKRVFGE